jgi:D-alanyl-D-alanine carboxypeptidase (penicillin-binding protein 5/6)
MAGFVLSALVGSALASPQVGAPSAIIVEESTGKVLWERNADSLRYPASTTKILTAMLLLEHSEPSEKLKAPSGVEDIEPSSMNLKTGEVVSVKDMLYALMLRSANDGAVATAVHVAGSVPAFADLMNRRAEQLGCTSTFFTNPSGLPDERHVTSARDLSMIARAALKYPLFREIVKTKKHRISRSINTKDLWMVNRNKHLFKDPSADGVKTGYTKVAKSTYVGSATREGFRVVDVLLGSEGWQKDHQAMLNWAYAFYDRRVAFKPGQVAGSTQIGGIDVPVFSGKGIVEIVTKDASVGTLKVEPLPNIHLPVKWKQHVANGTYTDADGFVQTMPLYAAEAVSPLAASKVSGNPVVGGTLWIGAGAFGLWMFWQRRRRNSFYVQPRSRSVSS